MVCGLESEDLFILNALYRHHCFSSNKSKNLGEIAKAFNAKFTDSNIDESIKRLSKLGYIAPKREIDIKYYISNMSRASYALNNHGYNATEGRIITGRIRKL